MKYIKITLTLIALLVLATMLPVKAQEEVEEPSPSPISEDEVKTNIKKRLQDSLKTVQQNLITDQGEIGNDKPKAYVGKVSEIIQNTVVITTKDGKRNATILDDTTLLRTPGNSAVKLENIRIDDFIIAMGLAKNEETIEGKRVIVSTTVPTPFTKTTVLGKIESLSRYAMTLQTKNETIELTLNSNTVYKSKSDILERIDLEEGDTVILIYEIDDSENYANIIMRIQESEPEPTPSPNPELDN